VKICFGKLNKFQNVLVFYLITTALQLHKQKNDHMHDLRMSQRESSASVEARTSHFNLF